MWSDWLVFCEYGFSVSPLWCPLATPTVSLGFSYLGHGISLHGCSSKVQLLLLTLDEVAPPDLECGVASFGSPAPVQLLLLIVTLNSILTHSNFLILILFTLTCVAHVSFYSNGMMLHMQGGLKAEFCLLFSSPPLSVFVQLLTQWLAPNLAFLPTWCEFLPAFLQAHKI